MAYFSNCKIDGIWSIKLLDSILIFRQRLPQNPSKIEKAWKNICRVKYHESRWLSLTSMCAQPTLKIINLCTFKDTMEAVSVHPAYSLKNSDIFTNQKTDPYQCSYSLYDHCQELQKAGARIASQHFHCRGYKAPILADIRTISHHLQSNRPTEGTRWIDQ